MNLVTNLVQKLVLNDGSHGGPKVVTSGTGLLKDFSEEGNIPREKNRLE